MLVLLTGGAGFIGRAVRANLISRGRDVRVLDSLRRDVHARVEHDTSGDVVVADVRDRNAVEAALRGVDVVCHLAAKVGLGVSAQDTPDYAGSNDYGTAVLLAAMATAGVTRLVLASSMVVYGDAQARCPDHGLVAPASRGRIDLQAGRFESTCPSCGGLLSPVPVGEDAPICPRNAYAASKCAQEFYASTWARGTGSRAALLRYHNVYGPGMPSGTPYAGVAALFASRLAVGEAPRVFEDGRQLRDFVHVRDVARATVAAIEAEADGAFNVGSGTPRTVGELARAMSRAANGPMPIVTGEFRLGDVRHITADSSRLARELGVTAREDFDAGMGELAFRVL